jgi:hypothetical protein
MAFSGGLVLEEVIDQLRDRNRNGRILYPEIVTTSLNALQLCTRNIIYDAFVGISASYCAGLVFDIGY